MILYFTVISIIFSISSVLDGWLSINAKEAIVKVITPSNFKDFNALINSINKLFIQIFDRIYKYSNTVINRNIYRSVIFCYVFFFIMKFFIWIFNLRIPPTENILFTIMIISLYTVMMYKSFTGILPDILKLREQPDRKITFLLNLLKVKKFHINLILYSVSFALFTIIIMSFSTYFGVNLKTYIVFSLWTIIVIFLSILIVSIPSTWFKVAPLKSFCSSLIFMFVITLGYLHFNNWDGTDLFVLNNALLFISYLTFNLFGDLISFQETRWILVVSQKFNFKYLPLFLILDIILSAICFLILPVVSNVSIYSLLQSLLFQGSNPWFGILFWTSFSTSIIYYFYIVAILITKLFLPMYLKCDEWFEIFKYPIRFIGVTSILIFSFSLLLIKLIMYLII